MVKCGSICVVLLAGNVAGASAQDCLHGRSEHHDQATRRLHPSTRNYFERLDGAETQAARRLRRGAHRQETDWREPHHEWLVGRSTDPHESLDRNRSEAGYAAFYTQRDPLLIAVYGLKFAAGERRMDPLSRPRKWDATVVELGPIRAWVSGARGPCFDSIEAHVKRLARQTLTPP
jgi:hypothetical protein